MRKYAFWYMSLSFAIGLSFGFFYESPAIKSIATLGEPSVTRILAPANLFPEDLLESYQLEYNAEIQLSHYSDEEDFEQKIGDGSLYDIILAPHTKVPELKMLGTIERINSNLLKNLENIAADFRDLPTDPGGTYSIPLVWGVKSSKTGLRTHYVSEFQASAVSPSELLRGFAQTGVRTVSFYENANKDRQIPALWIQSFVVSSRTQNLQMAYSFIDFFLTRDIAIELTTITKQSSTNLAVEQSHLDAKLKPSHLRTQKFSDLVRSL